MVSDCFGTTFGDSLLVGCYFGSLTALVGLVGDGTSFEFEAACDVLLL
jgi:hypothetical protein